MFPHGHESFLDLSSKGSLTVLRVFIEAGGSFILRLADCRFEVYGNVSLTRICEVYS